MQRHILQSSHLAVQVTVMHLLPTLSACARSGRSSSTYQKRDRISWGMSSNTCMNSKQLHMSPTPTAAAIRHCCLMHQCLLNSSTPGLQARWLPASCLPVPLSVCLLVACDGAQALLAGRAAVAASETPVSAALCCATSPAGAASIMMLPDE